jgi:hypothetical protein
LFCRSPLVVSARNRNACRHDAARCSKHSAVRIPPSPPV